MQQGQSAFLRILSGNVLKQTSMARGTRLHNTRCAIQQQEMVKEHAPGSLKYIGTSVGHAPTVSMCPTYPNRQLRHPHKGILVTKGPQQMDQTWGRGGDHVTGRRVLDTAAQFPNYVYLENGGCNYTVFTLYLQLCNYRG